MKKVVLFVLMFLALLAYRADAFVMIDVTKDAYIDDYDQAATVDGIPNSINNSQALFIGNGIMSDGNALEARGILTFNIGAFGGQSLDYAKLTGTGSRNSGQVMSVYLNSGNGQVELSDYYAPAALIGELPLATTGSYSNVQPFEFDITSALQTLLDDNTSYAEFRISSSATAPFHDAVILAGEAEAPFSIPDGQVGPRLVMGFRQATPVPEPMTIFLFSTGLVGAFLRRRQIQD